MTARDELVSAIDAELPAAAIIRLLAEYDVEQRAKVLIEAADFVRDAHFRDGLSVQEIGTGLRRMANTTTPTSKEQQR